jgi:phosphatidate phosphatase PAH1
VVSDIDGTITKSNARGVIDTIFTENYQYCHEGICNLLSNLAEQPNTQIMYVSCYVGIAVSWAIIVSNV